MNALLALAALTALGAYAMRRRDKDATSSSAAGPSSPEPGLTKEQIEGVREYTATAPPGYTRNIPALPPEANSFARQALGKPYGTVIGPSVLSDGNTYVAITESHFDDHVTNPRTGQKDKHWHKGASMFLRVS